MIRCGQNTLIFLVNNRGYVIESEIHDGAYNYIKNWDYAGLISALNAEDGKELGLKATTGKELADAIQQAQAHRGGPVLIECQIAHDDCSPSILEMGNEGGSCQRTAASAGLSPRPQAVRKAAFGAANLDQNVQVEAYSKL